MGPRPPRLSESRRRGDRLLARSVALPLLAHAAPSLLVLGQWWPRRASPLRSLPGGLCRWRGPETGRAEVALTFDDGPDPEFTLRVAELLESAGMRGTFFCLGERLERFPEVSAAVSSRGHELATHGYRHRHHLLQPGWETVADLARALEAHDRLQGARRPRYYRPPYGQVSAGSLLAARRAGLDVVLWSAWGREWAGGSPGPVARRIASRLSPGAIVLLHDSDATSPPGSAARGLKALEVVVSDLLAAGLCSVTLSELTRS